MFFFKKKILLLFVSSFLFANSIDLPIDKAKVITADKLEQEVKINKKEKEDLFNDDEETKNKNIKKDNSEFQTTSKK
jgi:hypothetical protein